MPEIICAEIAHRAGFRTSVGNWISPDGSLITGRNYEEHHWETLVRYLGHEPETENNLQYMHGKVQEGFIRLVFRADVLFQVSCDDIEQIWDDRPNHRMMMEVLEKLRDLSDMDVHIFSERFYVIGKAKDIADHRLDRLQTRVNK